MMSGLWSSRKCAVHWSARTFVAVALCLLVACATGPKVVEHGFSFDALRDSPDVRVLDYRYGQSKHLASRGKQPGDPDDRVRQAAGIYGAMFRPDILFVRWQIKSTGVVYEDLVELERRLPADLAKHEVRFVIRGPQLCVYLITPVPRPPGSAEGPLRMYRDLAVHTIYPDQSTSHTC